MFWAVLTFLVTFLIVMVKYDAKALPHYLTGLHGVFRSIMLLCALRKHGRMQAWRCR